MVRVLIQTESHYPINRVRITQAVTRALVTRIKGDVEVSVTIIGDRKMKSLNFQYRKKDYATDVLSFPLQDASQPSPVPFINPPGATMYLGDVVVSYPQAILEAQETNKLVDDVVDFLVLHGIEHLLGNHHPE